MAMTESELFNVFQPICVELTKEISHENITTLKRALHFVDKSSPFPEPLQEYLLFPLRIILKVSNRNSSQDILQATTECIICVLEKSPLTKWEILKDLLINFTIKLCNPKNFNEVADISEEFKISILKCIKTIIEKSDHNAVQHVYSEEFFPQLAHLIVLILEISQNEQARAVRITALNILTTLTFCKKKESLVDSRAISNTFATFIPKISTSLAKVILGDSVQGHGVTVAAMEAFMNAVLVSMNDDTIKETLESIQKSDILKEPSKTRPTPVQRNESWLKETAFNLNILIERLAELVSHSHWRVTLSLVELAGTLLLNCFNSLSKSTGKLLDILLILAAHETKPVAKKSLELLKCVMKKFSSTESFIDCLEDNLYELVSKLPRIIRNSDETKNVALLNLLGCYIQLLGPRVESLLLSNTHMRHLSLSLLQLAEMECTDINIVALKTSSADFSGKFGNENDDQYNPFKKVFKHFSSKKSYEEFIKICFLLGNYGAIESQIDYFLEVFTSSPVYRKESVLIMNWLLIGAAGILMSGGINGNLLEFLKIDTHKNLSAQNKTKLIKIINILLEEYLQPNIWMLPVSCDKVGISKSTHLPDLLMINSKENKNTDSVESLGNNICLICLLLEGIGNFSRVLEKDFIVLLRKILYPLLDKMSSDSALVSHTAFHTATVIALNTGNSTVAELIHNNADYLVNSLSLKLLHILENPSAPLILRVAVQNSGPDILPLLKDSVDELLNGLDHHHGQQAELFMEAINALVTGVHNWFSTTSFVKSKVPLKETSTLSMNEIENDSTAGIKLKDFFLNFHNLKNIAETNLEEDYANNFDSQDDNNNYNIEDLKKNENEEKTPPYYVTMLVQILERCVHVMSSTRSNVSLSILDTINKGILALEPWEDQLLPVVHKLWQPLIGRYADNNLVIVKKAFDIICTMANVCGDFVSKRMVEDVWPKIMLFLENQYKVSSSVDSKSYSFTSAYKLQAEMLARIASLSTQLTVPLENCDGLIRICVLYLNSNQPQYLQEAALDSLKGLLIVNADTVWLHLSSYIEDHSILPHSCFTFPKMLKHKEGKELHENTKKILIEKLHCSLASRKNF